MVGRHSAEIQLSCLHMNYVHSEDWPFLVESLPVTTKLRELKVGRSQPKAIHRTHNNWRIERTDSFIAALRANGSLRDVMVEHKDVTTPAQLRYVKVYTDRNRFVPDMLVSETVTPTLVPCLFAAVQAAPRTAPTTLFKFLQTALEAGTLVGPKVMGKRTR
jgi:hypothetical protein